MILKELGLLSLVTGEEVKAGSFRQRGCRDRGKEGESQGCFRRISQGAEKLCYPSQKGSHIVTEHLINDCKSEPVTKGTALLSRGGKRVTSLLPCSRASTGVDTEGSTSQMPWLLWRALV